MSLAALTVFGLILGATQHHTPAPRPIEESTTPESTISPERRPSKPPKKEKSDVENPEGAITPANPDRNHPQPQRKKAR